MRLGESHLAVFVHEMVERLDLRKFEQEHSDAGLSKGFPPQLLLKVWLYAYALGVDVVAAHRAAHSREDLGFRFLAGGWKPDHSDVERVSEAASDGFERRVYAGAGSGAWAPHGTDGAGGARFDAGESERGAGLQQHDRTTAARADSVAAAHSPLAEAVRSGWLGTVRWGSGSAPAQWQQRLEKIPRQLGATAQIGAAWRGSRTDPESRYLRQRGGFCFGYTAELAVSGRSPGSWGSRCISSSWITAAWKP